MSELIILAANSPLAAALVVAAALAAILYRLLPTIVTQRLNRAVDEDPTFRSRFERHARRVHDMTAVFGEARRMVSQFNALEDRVETVIRETTTLARDLASLKGLSEVNSERLGRIEAMLDRLSERLIGDRS